MLFSFVNRCAIDPGGTGCRPYNFPPNFRNLKTENRKLKTRIIGALRPEIIHYSLFIKRRGSAARTISPEFPHSKPNDIPPNFRNLKTENRKLKTRIIGASLPAYRTAHLLLPENLKFR